MGMRSQLLAVVASPEFAALEPEERAMPNPDLAALSEAPLSRYAKGGKVMDDEGCDYCADHVPAKGYWRCPACDVEWLDNEPLPLYATKADSDGDDGA